MQEIFFLMTLVLAVSMASNYSGWDALLFLLGSGVVWLCLYQGAAGLFYKTKDKEAIVLVQAFLVLLGFSFLSASKEMLYIFGLHLSAVEYGFVALFFGLVLALTHKPEELRVRNTLDNPDSASTTKAEDPNPSIPTLQKAAKQGDAGAQSSLGLMYYLGEGVPQDYTKAAYWFQKAAEQGHAQAQCNLGVMYRDGQGVPKDEAAYWFQKAADQGHAWATDALRQLKTGDEER